MTEGVLWEMRPEEGVRRLLTELLSSGKVEGILAPAWTEGKKVAYSMMASVEALKHCVPLHPLMPVNLGKVLANLTLKGPVSRPIAVVIRPCELRAFVEVAKRHLGVMDNLLFISCTCGGVFPLRTEVEGELDSKLDDYWDCIRNNEVHDGLRPACRSCVEFVPYTADLVARVVESTSGFTITAGSDRGRQLLSSLADPGSEFMLDEGRVPALRSKRSEERSRLFEERASIEGLDSFVKVFGRCIGCHACSKVCPVCNCTSCTFESATFERKPDDLYQELPMRKGVRLPPGTAQFHLGRMVHMAVSCVACGSCEDVCPVDIPVSLIFKKVGESLQRTFEYVPGRDPKEPVPLSAFEVEEFKGIGE